MKRLLVMIAVLVLAGSFLANVHAEELEEPIEEPDEKPIPEDLVPIEEPYEKPEVPVQATLNLSVTFKAPQVIAIELNKTSWVLDGVGLGEKRKNNREYIILTEPDGPPEPSTVMPPYSGPIHSVSNIGNVRVIIDIGYEKYSGCGAGFEPGVNQFATVLCEDGYTGGKAIPPYGQALLTPFPYLGPEDPSKDIPLVYYSPTEITGDIKGMSATYGLRAYPYPEHPAIPLEE